MGNTVTLPVVLDFEVVDKPLWEVPGWRRTQFRKDLRERGFVLARECWYHPDHWRIEAYDFGPEKGRYCVMSEAYVPLTAAAKAWRKKVIAEWKEQDQSPNGPR